MVDFKSNQRYPDPAVLILDPSFAKYRIYSSSVEQLGTGMRWAEGPVISLRKTVKRGTCCAAISLTTA